MRDENMVEFAPFYFIPGQLHLGAFTAINQQKLVI
jgi:hypothetical protein